MADLDELAVFEALCFADPAMAEALRADPGQSGVDVTPALVQRAAELLASVAAGIVPTPAGIAGVAAAGAPAGNPGAPAAGPAAGWGLDTPRCPGCAAEMRRGASGYEAVCSGCGLLLEGDSGQPDADEAQRPAAPRRFRIVGAGSAALQPDAFRSGGAAPPEAKINQTYEEYVEYRNRYVEAGGTAIPLNALRQAAVEYHKVQQRCVKRNDSKRVIMAACLWHACIAIQYAPTKSVIAGMMQLRTKGIARGDNFMYRLDADTGGQIIEGDADVMSAEINTLFVRLRFEGPQYDRLRQAVRAVVELAIEHNIGTNSVLRSKIHGAAFAVFQRCRDPQLVPAPLSCADVCGKQIRPNTVTKFTKELDAYHDSFFRRCFEEAGLDPRRADELAEPPPPRA